MNPSDALQSHEFFFSKITAPGTGEWLLKGDKYNEWKITPNSFLWLQGDGKFNSFCDRPNLNFWKCVIVVGSGKSVLACVNFPDQDDFN